MKDSKRRYISDGSLLVEVVFRFEFVCMGELSWYEDTFQSAVFTGKQLETT